MMSYDEVVMGRRSIRGFKPDPVPLELIKEILTMAMRSPSSMNTQPWNFTVVTAQSHPRRQHRTQHGRRAAQPRIPHWHGV